MIPERPALLRGMPTARIGKKVIDPITVTALALETENSGRAIMVSADLGGIDTGTMARARATLENLASDFNPALMIVNATHTHTSLSGLSGVYPQPKEDCMTPEETVAFMGDKIAAAAAAAWRNRKPGAVAWGYGQAVVGHNRRASYYSGETKMYGKTTDTEFSHIEGYEDHGVGLLFTFDKHKQPTGVIVNLACPSQCSASLSVISADFWHEARQEIRRQLGKKLFILPQCSAAGDQSPTLLLDKNAETRMLAFKEDVPVEKLNFFMAQRREIGQRIAAAVTEVLPLAAREIHDRVRFHHQPAILELPIRLISDADLAEAEAELAKARKSLQALDPAVEWNEYSRHYRQACRYRRVIERYAAQKEKQTFSVEVHVVRLGDIVFATNPFELFLDFGIQIKARSPAIQTFVVQLAGNGSYIPTERALAGKGYGAEPVSNQVGPEGGKMIVEETIKILKNL